MTKNHRNPNKTIFDKLKYQWIEDQADGSGYILNTKNQRYEMYLIEGRDCYFSSSDFSSAVSFFDKEFLDLQNATIESFSVTTIGNEIIDEKAKDESYIIRSQAKFLQQKAKTIKKYICISTDKGKTKIPTDEINSDLHKAFLEMMQLKYKKLTAAEIKEVIFGMINFEDSFQSVSSMTPREELIQNQVSYSRAACQIGEKHIKVLTCKFLPDDLDFFDLDKIIDFFQFNFVFSASMTVMNQSLINSALAVSRNLHAGKDPKKITIDHKKQKQYRDSENLIGFIIDNNSAIITMNLKIIIYDNDMETLNLKAKEVITALKGKKFYFFEEEYIHDEEFFKSLPALTVFSDRGFRALSHNGLSTLSLSKIYSGDVEEKFPAFFRTSAGTLYGYDSYNPVRNNWNVMCLGCSGSGKTFFISNIAGDSMIPRIQEDGGKIFILDFAGDDKSTYKKLVDLYGGIFVPLGTSSKVSWNPFPDRKDFITKGEINSEMLNFLGICVDTIIGNKGDDSTAKLKRFIVNDIIIQMYKDIEKPMLEDMLQYKNIEVKEKGLRDEIFNVLEGFIKSSPESKTINCRETSVDFTHAQIIVIDMHGLSAYQESTKQLLTFIIINFASRIAYKTPGFCYLIFDEVARHIKDKIMADYIEELYMTVRKYGAAIWTITQNYLNFKECNLGSKLTSSPA